MLNNCPVVHCDQKKSRRYLLCKRCWAKLPGDLKHPSEFRPVSKSNPVDYTLRAVPVRDWFNKVIPHVGMIKIPVILGAGISAVKVANDRSELTGKSSK